MNKRWLIVAALMAVMSMQSISVMAMDTAETDIYEVENNMDLGQNVREEKGMYITKTGEITSINKENENCEILVGSETEGIRFVLQPDNIIMDAATLQMLHAGDLQTGMNVTVVIDKNSPMTMSLPAMCSSQTAVLVNAADKHVEVAYFDETLTNEANTLALNISEKTMIQNSRGERRIFTAEDIKNQNAVVIYTTSTRSIPAQTNPEYVMVLSSNEEDNEAGEKQEEEQTASAAENQTAGKYVLLRDAATSSGYEVKWDQAQKTVRLYKDDNEIILTVNKTSCTYNKEVINLEGAVKLEENRVYVPENFLAVLK